MSVSVSPTTAAQPRRISLVMPTFRRGDKIGPALESVYAQTIVPDEVVIVNDGGFEETSAYVASRYPQATLLNVTHRGAALARNTGAQHASGDILIFFDDDDVMLPHAVEKLLSLLTMFPEARAAHTDHTFTNCVTGEHHPNHHFFLPQFARLRQVVPLRVSGSDRLYDRRLFSALLWGNLLQQPWAVYRDVFLELGGFHPDLGASDDWDLYLRTTRHVPIALSDDICSNHFLEKDKTTHLTMMSGQADVQIAVLRRVLVNTPPADVQTRLTVWRRLALLHKWAGDLLSSQDLRSAWRHYLKALSSWPFDAVVVARGLVIWPLRLAFGRGTRNPDVST